MLLSSDKGKSPAEFEHKALELADDGLLKVRFSKTAALRDAEELKHIRVFDVILRCGCEGIGLFLHFPDDRLFVATCQQALVVERIDLTRKGAGAPVLFCGLIHIPGSGIRLLHPYQKPVVCPG